MRDYGKISTSIWNSRKFQSLKNDDARLAYLYLHTCPSVNSIGCFVLKDGYAAADLGWPTERYRTAIEALSIALLIGVDESESLVRIVDFLKHDPFTNKNHAAGAIKIARTLPVCNERANLFRDIAGQKFIEALLSDGDLAIGLSIGVSNGYRTPEPEPEPEPEPKKVEAKTEAVASAKKTTEQGSRLPKDWQLPKPWGLWAVQQGLTVEDVRAEAAKFRDYWISVPGAKARKLDWEAVWRNWMRKRLDDRKPPSRPDPGDFWTGPRL